MSGSRNIAKYTESELQQDTSKNLMNSHVCRTRMFMFMFNQDWAPGLAVKY